MQPNNPIVGGTVLRRPAIQSPNYVPATSGWAVFADGSAEFNNVTIRGQLTEGSAPTGAGLIITTGGAIQIYDSGGNLVGSWDPATSLLLVEDAAGDKVILDPKNVNGPTLQFQDSTGLNTTSFHQTVTAGPIITLVISAATIVDMGSSELRAGTIKSGGVQVPTGSGFTQVHVQSITGTTGATGLLTVNHGAAFTPTRCWAVSSAAGANNTVFASYDTLGATSVRTRWHNPAVGGYANTLAVQADLWVAA